MAVETNPEVLNALGTERYVITIMREQKCGRSACACDSWTVSTAPSKCISCEVVTRCRDAECAGDRRIGVFIKMESDRPRHRPA